MSNLSAERYIKKVGGEAPAKLQMGVDAGASKIWEGAMVTALTATGMAVRAGTASSGHVLGVAEMTVDSSGDSVDGTKSINLLQGMFWFTNHASDTVVAADVGKACYVSDDQTVAHSASAGAVAGMVCAVDSTDGVLVFISAASNEALEANEFGADRISVHSFRESSSGGDVGAIAANGGILASDTTPIMRGDANTSQEISWAAGNADPVVCQITLPADFDGSFDCTLDLYVYTDNAGGGGIDAASFTVGTSWDGAAAVADTATDGTPAVTIHKITATIAAADIPDTASTVTILLTPAAHAADPTQLVAARLNYKRR